MDQYQQPLVPNTPYQQGYDQQQYPQQPYPQQPGMGYQQQYPQGGMPQQQYPQGGMAPQQYPQMPQGGVSQPAQYSAPQMTNGQYDYLNVQYQQISVNQFSSIPADQTEYSQYWDSPSAFESETFSENIEKSTKSNDVCWKWSFLIFFLLGLIGGIVLCALMPGTFNDIAYSYAKTLGFSDDSLETSHIFIALGIAVALGVVFNLGHYFYAAFAPTFYIKGSIWLGIVIGFAICIIPVVLFGDWFYLLFGVFFALVGICVYFCIRHKIPMSAETLRLAGQVLREYPSALFVIIIQGLTVIVVSIVFGVAFCELVLLCTLVEDDGVTYTHNSTGLIIAMIVYLFWYYWSTQTFIYVFFMTTSGTMGTYYFLHGTQQMPKSPVWQSFKRASTTSFGSAALAGFIVSVINMLQSFLDDRPSNAGALCIWCVAKCILTCIQAIVGVLNYYGLIYCSLFGVPFFEGARRFIELKCKKFVNVLLGGIIVKHCLNFNMFLFSCLSAFLNFGLCYALCSNNLYACLIGCFSALGITLVIFSIFKAPFQVYPDTILICFSECPERLREINYQLTTELEQSYNATLLDMIGKQSKKKN